jgi:hypothetical protein
MATEGATLAAAGGDARRLLLSRLVLEHKLLPRDPLDFTDGAAEARLSALLLGDEPVQFADAGGI